MSEREPTLTPNPLVDLSGDQPVGWYVKGHHDKAEFAFACNWQDGPAPGDRDYVEPRDARHAYWRQVPLRGRAADFFRFVDAPEGGRGAFPVTYINFDERDLGEGVA